MMQTIFKSIAIILSYAAISAAPLHAQTVQKDIVETAVAAASFTTLAGLLSSADLLDTLKGEGPFTVFAPTDEAFTKLPTGTISALGRPENKALLTAILTNHVVAGEITLSKALAASEATTHQGSKVSIRFEDGKVKIDDSTLMSADTTARNGVIHVIDTVLIPAGLELCAPDTELNSYSFTPQCLEKVERLRVLLNKKFPQ